MQRETQRSLLREANPIMRKTSAQIIGFVLTKINDRIHRTSIRLSMINIEHAGRGTMSSAWNFHCLSWC
jgi:hypothetical protein